MEYDPARYRYQAFVSRSHADEAWARCLQGLAPSAGQATPGNRIPRRPNVSMAGGKSLTLWRSRSVMVKPFLEPT
ncbi:hypothetical protein [Panacagrimonas sp.]|uniref:hypothetical protein n=1 Tax=Panacagrimonas sp. TaxID=2480088 RepID=UPI003B51641E